MSYYTSVEFTFADGNPPDIQALLAVARSYLEAHDQVVIIEQVLHDLKIGFKKEKVVAKCFASDDLEELMKHVSAGFPGVEFFVRGVGEEFPDVWLRVFKNGDILFEVGPFEDQLDSALR